MAARWVWKAHLRLPDHDPTAWQEYSPHDSDKLERGFEEDPSNTRFALSRTWGISFQHMSQFRLDQPKRRRRIRRLLPASDVNSSLHPHVAAVPGQQQQQAEGVGQQQGGAGTTTSTTPQGLGRGGQGSVLAAQALVARSAPATTTASAARSSGHAARGPASGSIDTDNDAGTGASVAVPQPSRPSPLTVPSSAYDDSTSPAGAARVTSPLSPLSPSGQHIPTSPGPCACEVAGVISTGGEVVRKPCGQCRRPSVCSQCGLGRTCELCRVYKCRDCAGEPVPCGTCRKHLCEACVLTPSCSTCSAVHCVQCGRTCYGGDIGLTAPGRLSLNAPVTDTTEYERLL